MSEEQRERVLTRLTDRLDVIAFLDDRYPEIGTDNKCFAVYVVLLSAVILGTIHEPSLEEFTRYTPRFVEAVVANLKLNGLVHGGQYDTCRWLKEGGYIDDERFCEDMEAASGSLYLHDGVPDLAIDVIYIEHDPPKGGVRTRLRQ